jgi:Ca2+-binding RTX toxin-like protein
MLVVVTDPTGAKQYIQITSSEQLGRNTNGTAADASGTYSFTATMAGHYQFDWIVGNGRDDGKDSSMSVAAPTVTVGGTTYGAPVVLGIAAGLTDTDGSESLALTVSGVPTGAALSAGTSLGGGVWSLTSAQLDGLSLLPGTGYTGTVNLTVTATSTEASNGSTATSTQTIAVTVDATTNSIAGTAAGETLSGSGSTNDVIYGYGGNDTLNGNNGNDILYGGAGNDSLSGGAGNDILYGGSGSDALTGGAGADVFAWSLADRGTSGAPPTDTIADFSVAAVSAGGDLLDLRDLLQGETRTGGTGNLDNYLDFDTTSSAGNTIIRISSSGGFTGGVYNAGAEDQRIVLTGVDVRSAATFGLSASATDSQIIAELLNRGKLVTDPGP